MKKLLLLPKTDTVTICLPPDWVGHPIICILKAQEPLVYPIEIQEEEMKYKVQFIKNRKSRIKKQKEDQRKQKRTGRFY